MLEMGAQFRAIELLFCNRPDWTGALVSPALMDASSTSSYSRASILICYASQTGTAQEISGDIARSLRKLRFSCRVVSLADYAIQGIRFEKLVIFVVSTYGQGEFPESAKPAWAFLRRTDLPPTSLIGLRFAVFGLGDSSYSRFNVASKMLNARLLQLGATALLERGDGDDQHRLGLYGGFIPWLTSLTTLLSNTFPLPSGETIQEGDALPPPSYRLHVKLEPPAGPSSISPFLSHETSPPRYSELSPYMSKVISNERITSEDWTQDVRHIALDASSLEWKPGDIVYIQPKNIEDEVDSFLRRLKLTGQEWIDSVERLDPEAPAIPTNFSSGVSLRHLVSGLLDISGIPRRYFFELLSFFASDPVQAAKLRELSSVEGQEDLNEYARKAKRSFLDVLSDFDSVTPPLDYILDLIPKLQPRPFSISSSRSFNPAELTLSMVVVKYRSASNRLRRGVCSTWLAATAPGPGSTDSILMPNDAPQVPTSIPMWLKPGTMVLPADPLTPLIMIGPGTGCAIFRAFVQERLHLAKSTVSRLGPAVFYFGCRHESKDFLYRDLWLDALRGSALSMLAVAFSRDKTAKRFTLSNLTEDASDQSVAISTSFYESPANVSSFYVQHCIKQDAVLLWKLISSQNASIFVCGNSNKMPTDVRKALIMVAMSEGGLADVEAESLIRNMEAQRRYCVESWA